MSYWLDALELVHRLRKVQKTKKQVEGVKLRPWDRTQAGKHVDAMMSAANVEGLHATPKGLRLGFGIKAAEKTRNPRFVQKWLGYANLDSTFIYVGCR